MDLPALRRREAADAHETWLAALATRHTADSRQSTAVRAYRAAVTALDADRSPEALEDAEAAREAALAAGEARGAAVVAERTAWTAYLTAAGQAEQAARDAIHPAPSGPAPSMLTLAAQRTGAPIGALR